MYGYVGKMLFIDLGTRTTEERPLSEELAKNFLGGPSLGAKVLYDEMPANTDVFAPESMLGFVTAPLNGTKALFGGRYTVVSKSPVYNGWNDANSGGFFGPMLRKAGYDAVFVKGISEKPVYIYIEDGKVEFHDASHLWGLCTIPVEKALRQTHGEKINAALIGPAGENLSNFAAVMNDEHRAAGRGGSGAVMGSKKLKALVVKGGNKIQQFSDEEVFAANKKLVATMKGPMAGMAGALGTYGSGVLYQQSILIGDASIKNWTGSYKDYPDEIAVNVGSIGMDKFKTKKYNCASCPMGCGAHLNVPSERWDLSKTSRPEYETMGGFGSQMLNGDHEAVCRCNDLCNEYGFDTISMAGTVAWAMECYNEGLLSRDDLDGIDLKWGNGDAIVAITQKICDHEGVGKILTMGSRWAAKHFGKGEECLVAASGIEEPQHDSRLGYGLARTYQYDPTPGRHVKGGLGPAVHITPGMDFRGTGYKDMLGTAFMEICNSSGYCLFGMMVTSPFPIIEQLSGVTGFRWSPPEVTALGLRMFTIRHAFNLREGFRRKDFTIQKRYYQADPPFDGPLAGVRIDHELLADNFFNAIGWDMDMVPYKESLEILGGLEDVIADLYPAPAPAEGEAPAEEPAAT